MDDKSMVYEKMTIRLVSYHVTDDNHDNNTTCQVIEDIDMSCDMMTIGLVT